MLHGAMFFPVMNPAAGHRREWQEIEFCISCLWGMGVIVWWMELINQKEYWSSLLWQQMTPNSLWFTTEKIYFCWLWPFQCLLLWSPSSMSYKSTQFWHYLPRDSFRLHRLRALSYKTALCPQLKTPITSPACHLCFWSEIPMTSILNSTSLLGQLTELRETFPF